VWGTSDQPIISDEKLFSFSDIKESCTKELGVNYLLSNIADSIGLTAALKSTFPKNWEEIFALASFMVATNDPAMYCEDWLNRTDGYNVGPLTSSLISALLMSITDQAKMDFYNKWAKLRIDNEVYALDITSISSYSELIKDVAIGYNRDGDKLPQINVCLFVGEKSRLPIFQMIYNGALKDVSTLMSTLSVASGLELNKLSIVMDKGFAKITNIDFMLENDTAKFIIALPFTMSFTKKQVTMEKDVIDTFENTIIAGRDSLRGITKILSWNSKYDVYTHIFFNPKAACSYRDELYSRVISLKKLVLTGQNESEHDDDIAKYLIVKIRGKSKNVTVREDVIKKELAHKGWMVAISNFIQDPTTAIEVYRGKDIVEKSFDKQKNWLGLGRLRVHSDTAMQSKMFVGFIALIMTSYINKIMEDKKLYDKMTMQKLIKQMETLKVVYVKGKRVVQPLTSAHKLILKAFEFLNPDEE
jgi:transposase